MHSVVLSYHVFHDVKKKIVWMMCKKVKDLIPRVILPRNDSALVV